MITKDMAIALRVFYHVTFRYKNGAAVQARANGNCTTWKTRPSEFRLPLKIGLRGYGYITQDNAHEWLPYDPTEPEQIEARRQRLSRLLRRWLKHVELSADTPWEIGRDKLLEEGMIQVVNMCDAEVRCLATLEEGWKHTVAKYITVPT